ncbi:cyclin-D3-3-like [Vigna umbellata]|uniref:cyclin-D3-3-like n=1 Tax=Vigna umbellata TaxID=87088 RepID=UPI001F5FAD6D|nr:cyclin-D3-3-like [Vigna umbellata]
MANHHHHHHAHDTNLKSLLDTLYCSEEHWEENVGEDELDQAEDDYPTANDITNNNATSSTTLINSLHSPHALFESDMFCDEQELTSLLGKEKHNPLTTFLRSNPALECAHREGVEWMLRVNAHYSFSALTALLAVNYFDRFLSTFRFQDGKPWMTHLAAVACLSLAAKVEETQVPLLLDLQVEEGRYLFEAKTIKRMEILVLSTLGWKMNPPTPLSFLDYITRRLGLKDNHCWDFLRKCEGVLVSVLGDWRLMGYLPSELASATMIHVVKSVEPCLEGEYQRQLLGILRFDKEKVNECGKVLELWSGYEKQGRQCMKRKFGSVPGSPNGVMEMSFSCDSSNEEVWRVVAGGSVCCSPKKSRSEVKR